MTAALPGRARAFLRCASLLAGILALVAGILGMHIMTGSHSMAASAVSPGTDLAQAAQATAAPTPAPGGVAVRGTRPALGPASMTGGSCADAGVCATMSAMGEVCIPSPGNPPVEVPLPGVTSSAAAVRAPSPAGFAPYPYLPASPSPGELCISRT